MSTRADSDRFEAETPLDEPSRGFPVTLIHTIALVVIGAIAIAGLVFGLLAYFEDDPEPVVMIDQAPSAAPFSTSTIVSESDLRAYGAANPTVYWAGPRDDMAYELTVSGGNSFIRYLPEGTSAGDASSEFLTVATYVVTDGYQLLADEGDTDGAASETSETGALVVTYADDPTRAYFAFDGADLQVEVFAPDDGVASELVADGSLVVLR